MNRYIDNRWMAQITLVTIWGNKWKLASLTTPSQMWEYEGGSLMLWVCFDAGGACALLHRSKTLRSDQKAKFVWKWVFQKGNEPIYKWVTKFFKGKWHGVLILSYSDINRQAKQQLFTSGIKICRQILGLHASKHFSMLFTELSAQ